MMNRTSDFKLVRKDGKVLLRFAGDGKGTPVTVVWARPISARGREVSLLDEKQREVLMLDGLHELDRESRAIAAEALERRYLIPEITRVLRAEAHFGNRFWEVETTHGARRFAMRDPNKNVTWVTEDHLVLRDVLGNCYEIPALSALDARSRRRAELAL